MNEIGKLLIIAGGVLVVIGLAVTLGPKIGLGRLPGDFVVHRRNVTFVFPVASCVLVSLILTLLMWVFSRLRH